MPRLGNPLVYDLLAVATTLAEQTGRTNLRKAAMRRGVSSAYYAVFHALCFVCASSLVGWGRTDTLVPIYRSLEHGLAKNRLRSIEAKEIGSHVLAIGTSFAQLQEARHAADYNPPGLPVRTDETLNLIARAREIVTLIENLDANDRLRVAILLIARQRSA